MCHLDEAWEQETAQSLLLLVALGCPWDMGTGVSPQGWLQPSSQGILLLYLPRLLSLGPSPPPSWVWGQPRARQEPWQLRVCFSRERGSLGLAPAVPGPAQHRHFFQDSSPGLLQPPQGMEEQSISWSLQGPSVLLAEPQDPGTPTREQPGSLEADESWQAAVLASRSGLLNLNVNSVTKLITNGLGQPPWAGLSGCSPSCIPLPGCLLLGEHVAGTGLGAPCCPVLALGRLSRAVWSLLEPLKSHLR